MQGGPDHPKAPLGNNFRPPQPLLHRPVRTNIDFRTKQNGKVCPTMYKDVHYKGTYLLLYFFIKTNENRNKENIIASDFSFQFSIFVLLFF